MAVKKETRNKIQETKKAPKASVKAAPKAKAEVKAAPKKSGLTAVAYNAKGEKGTELSLNEAIFGQKENKQILAQAVRVYLSNQRSAQAKTKTRAEVDRTGTKIYRQKGTGGARHGSRRAPIYVGGGIAHGPNGFQNYGLEMSKALKKKALAVALSAKARSGQLIVADIEKIEPKTKSIAQALKKMEIKGKTVVVANSKALNLAARNIAEVTVVNAKELTAYHVLLGKNVVITGDALETIEGRYKNA